MAKIQLGHQLYIYQLIAKEYGTGHQIFLPKAEELFRREGIEPEDLGCETFHDVMEACSDFVTLTDFKGGRSYITIVQNEQWDEALSAPAPEKGSGKAGKPWKKKKGSQLKAVKPRHIQKKQKKAGPAPKAEEKAPEQKPEDTSPAPAPEAPAPETPAEEPEKTEARPVSEEAAELAAPAPAEPEASPAPETAKEAETPKEEDLSHPHVFTLDEIRAMPAEPAEPEPEPEAAEKPAENAKAQAAPAEPAPAENAPEQPSEAAAAAPEPEAKAMPEPEAAAPAAAEPVAYEPAQKPQQAEKAASEALPRTLPRSFSSEVHCKDELMSMLTRMLPFDIDLVQVLDEDWQHALATGAVEGSRSRVSFPIRFLAEDGSTPVRLTIRRSTRPIAGKQWSLVLVDGDDGTGHAHDAVGIEGLPHVDEGAWSDLLPASQEGLAASPERELSRFASIDSWESALGTLARMAAPESWSCSGSDAERYPILHEYLVSTFSRLIHEKKVLELKDAGFAAFNTGLVTAFQEDIYACLAATPDGPAPWHLAGFAVAGAGEVGQKLVALMNPLPEPAQYLTSLADIQPDSERLVSIDYRGILLHETDRLPKAFLAAQLEGTPQEQLLEALFDAARPLSERIQARTDLGHALSSDPTVWRRLCRDLDDALRSSLVHARTSYRWCAPAYVPTDDTLRLLVPLALADGRTPDTALALELMPSGSYQASSVVTLDRARACTRVISSEQPSWLRA
ncbi:MAG: DUF3825 domain-containing protein [Atopobiaceae bacterium]